MLPQVPAHFRPRWGACVCSLTLQLLSLPAPAEPGLLTALGVLYHLRVPFLLQRLRTPYSAPGWAPEGGAGTPRTPSRSCVPSSVLSTGDRRLAGAVLLPMPPFTFSPHLHPLFHFACHFMAHFNVLRADPQDNKGCYCRGSCGRHGVSIQPETLECRECASAWARGWRVPHLGRSRGTCRGRGVGWLPGEPAPVIHAQHITSLPFQPLFGDCCAW